MSHWLPSTARDDDGLLRLLCFPHAGGGSAMFHRWRRRLDGIAHVVPINLPGRENRSREPAIDSLPQLIEQMSQALGDFVATGPVAMFGHSMGGLISYEWAQRLRREGIEVEHLFISAYRLPGQPQISTDPLHMMPDRTMIEHLNGKYGAGTITSKGEVDLMMNLASTIRADLKLLETCIHLDYEPLTCPLSVLGGSEDEQITQMLLQEWEPRTVGNFKLQIFPGHHFYLRNQEEAVTNFIRSQLEQ